MKRNIISSAHYLIISLLILASCKGFNGYKISGKIKNGDGIKVYLEDIMEPSAVIIDTATIIAGKFQLKNYSTSGILQTEIR